MTKPATGAALVVQGIGKRYRLGRGGGLVPVPLFGNRLDRIDRDRHRDVEDDDELEEDEDEELEERPATGPTRELWALRDVNLVVQPGEAVGVVGPTGSGKSTLMKILGRITPPTEGRIEVQGRVAPMLGSLSGFVVSEATVRANVGILARFLGVPHAVVARNLESILRFAELEDLAHMKVKYLSRGMSDRLAYAVGLHFEPDVLLADDRVVAGDPPFQERCLARIEELLARRTALVFASNRLSTVTELCTHGLWLEGGQVRAHGRVEEVVDAYGDSLRPPEQSGASAHVDASAGPEPEVEPEPEPGPEPAAVTITAVRLVTQEGDLRAEARAGETVTIEIDLGVREVGLILTGSVAFVQGDERPRFIAPSPHVVDVPGRHLLQARMTLDGLVAGDYLGTAGVIVNHPDGRASDFLRSMPFPLRVKPPEEDGGQRPNRPSASWTVTILTGDPVAPTPAA
jgi:ABC-type polysaccharide/polyol phosphate transport system ATPase subunit